MQTNFSQPCWIMHPCDWLAMSGCFVDQQWNFRLGLLRGSVASRDQQCFVMDHSSRNVQWGVYKPPCKLVRSNTLSNRFWYFKIEWRFRPTSFDYSKSEEKIDKTEFLIVQTCTMVCKCSILKLKWRSFPRKIKRHIHIFNKLDQSFYGV